MAQNKIKSKTVVTVSLSDHFSITSRKIGHLYNNGIIVQEVFSLVRNNKIDYDPDICYTFPYEIPVLSQDVNISSSDIKILLMDSPDINYQNMTLTLLDKQVIVKGRLKKISNIGNYSFIELIEDQTNNEVLIKSKDFKIEQFNDDKKIINITLSNSKNNIFKMSIYYTIYFTSSLFAYNQENDNKPNWFIHHFLYVSNESLSESDIIETNQGLNKIKYDTKVIFKSLNLCKTETIFNKLHLINQNLYLNKNNGINYTNTYEGQEMNRLSAVQEIPTSRIKGDNESKITSNILETLNGNITLKSQHETFYNLTINETMEARLYNSIEINFDMLNINEMVEFGKPITELVFVKNYPRKNLTGGVSTNPVP